MIILSSLGQVIGEQDVRKERALVKWAGSQASDAPFRYVDIARNYILTRTNLERVLDAFNMVVKAALISIVRLDYPLGIQLLFYNYASCKVSHMCGQSTDQPAAVCSVPTNVGCFKHSSKVTQESLTGSPSSAPSPALPRAALPQYTTP